MEDTCDYLVSGGRQLGFGGWLERQGLQEVDGEVLGRQGQVVDGGAEQQGRQGVFHQVLYPGH